MRVLLFLAGLGLVAAEDGLNGWLRYAPLSSTLSSNSPVASNIVVLSSNQTSPVYSAGQELKTALRGILGKDVTVTQSKTNDTSVIVGTVDDYNKAYGSLPQNLDLDDDGFWLSTGPGSVTILGQNERGALYGTFEYLSMLAQGNFSHVSYANNPSAPIRWVNQWDNLDSSIERGYGGFSIFFNNGVVRDNLTRVSEYGRLLASIRVNGIIINNVNADANMLNSTNLQGLGRVADAMRPWGVRVGIALNFASPQLVGGLATFDPLDPSVMSFWANVTDKIHKIVPDFAGYLVKADSEGQPGPLTYNRTLAEGANVFARPLQTYGGIVMFRAFVYDQLNESDWKADRANAAVDFFNGLDGKFDDNVVVQIKYGPIDFQIREPASPLFAHLVNTSTAIELEVTQEYLGQQCHIMYHPPLWKTVLDFDMRNDGKPSLVRDIITGKRFGRKLGGSAAVVNVGTNLTWLGSHLAMANLYAYGRLAWDPTSDPEAMLQDWSRLTFGLDGNVTSTITKMLMLAWPTYLKYSGNLGIQTLTDILYTHYGPNPASQDNNGWGQWTRADRTSIGMDRTVSNGTGFSGQYPPEVAQAYENISTTPDDLLLWFHHVPYTQVLQTNKTVIQHFYDAHYEGAATAQTFAPMWESLKGKVDDERHADVLLRLTYQAGHALVWRDAVSEFYRNLSGIEDGAGRVGNHSWRIEVESMALEGYNAVAVTPFEAASNATAIVTSSNSSAGTATTIVPFTTGTYDLAVNYFDVLGGRARWQIWINGAAVGEWAGNLEDTLGKAGSTFLDGHSAARVTFRNVSVAKGDTLKIVGTPDGTELAPLDYVSFLPAGVVD